LDRLFDKLKIKNMKTFGIFAILWLVSIFMSFAIWQGSKIEEMLKMLLATQLAYIFYSLAKQELKD